MSDIYKQGDVFAVDAMFCRTLHSFYDGSGDNEFLSWKPGFEFEARTCAELEPYPVFHGWGKVVYTVISYHKLPKPYPARVFYTRKFVDPDGKEFGKNGLKIKSVGNFKSMVKAKSFPNCSEFDAPKLVEYKAD